MASPLDTVRTDNPGMAGLSDRDLIRMIGMQTGKSEDEVLSHISASLPPEKAPRITSADPDIPTPNEQSQSIYDKVEGKLPGLDQNALATVRKDNPHMANLSDHGLVQMIASQTGKTSEEISQHLAAPEPDRPSGLTGVGTQVLAGGRQAARSVAAVGGAMLGSKLPIETMAHEAGVDRAKNTPVEQQAFLNQIHDSTSNDDSLAKIVYNVGKAAISNPTGVTQFVSEQAANTLVALAPAVAGMKAGAAAGAVAGPAGVVAGAFLGGATGLYTGNLVVEYGNTLLDKASLSESEAAAGRTRGKLTELEQKTGLNEARLKAAGITSVDLITLGIGALVTKLMVRPAIRAASRAELDTLAAASVDVTSLPAIKNALATNVGLAEAVKTAGDEAFKVALTTTNKAAIVAGNAALQTVGEGVGEAAGSYLATGKVDKVDAVLGSLAGGFMTAIETAATYKTIVQPGTDIAGISAAEVQQLSDTAIADDAAKSEEAKVAASGMNAAAVAEGVDAIHATGSVEDAISTFEEGIQSQPVVAAELYHPTAQQDAVAAALGIQPGGFNETTNAQEADTNAAQTKEAEKNASVLAPAEQRLISDLDSRIANSNRVIENGDPAAYAVAERMALIALKKSAEASIEDGSFMPPTAQEHIQALNAAAATLSKRAGVWQKTDDARLKKTVDALTTQITATEQRVQGVALQKTEFAQMDAATKAKEVKVKEAPDATTIGAPSVSGTADVDNNFSGIRPPTPEPKAEVKAPVTKVAAVVDTPPKASTPEDALTEIIGLDIQINDFKAKVKARRNKSFTKQDEATLTDLVKKREVLMKQLPAKAAEKVAAVTTRVAEDKAKLAQPVEPAELTDTEYGSFIAASKSHPDMVQRQLARGTKDNLTNRQVFNNIQQELKPEAESKKPAKDMRLPEEEQRARNLDIAENMADIPKYTKTSAAHKAAFDKVLAEEAKPVSEDALDHVATELDDPSVKRSIPGVPARSGMTADEVEKAIEGLRNELKSDIKIEVVEAINLMPLDVLVRLGDGNRTGFDGLYDAKTDTVYLVAENIPTADRAVWVAVHEIIGHGGIRRLDVALDNALSFAGNNKFIEDLGKAIALSRKEVYAKDEHTDEAIAELAAALVTSGTQPLFQRYGIEVPANAKARSDKLIARIIEALRRFINKVLGKYGKTTDAQILELILANIKAVRSGVVTQGNNTARTSRPPSADRANQGSQESKLIELETSNRGPDQVELPGVSSSVRAQIIAQDEMAYVKILEDFVKDTLGITLSENAKIYRQENLTKAMMANAREDFRRIEVKPVIDALAAANIGTWEIAEYMEMLHIATEANERLQNLHNDPAATANGIPTDVAQAIVDEYQARKDFGKIDTITGMMRKIIDGTLDMELKEGLISTEQHTAYRKTFKNYVPLRGKDRTFSAKHKSRFGHRSRDEYVFENSVAAREVAIAQVYRNRLVLNVLMFLKEVNRDDIGTVAAPIKMMVRRDEAYAVSTTQDVTIASFLTRAEAEAFKALQAVPSDMKVEKTYDPNVVMRIKTLLQPNELEARVAGHTVRLQINQESLQEALVSSGAEGANLLITTSKDALNFLSKTYTAWNIDFVLVNPIRDLGMAPFILTGKRGIKFAAKAASYYPWAIKELTLAVKDGIDSRQWVKEYREDGGNTNAGYVADNEKIRKETTDQLYEFMTARGAYTAAKQHYMSEQIANAQAGVPISGNTKATLAAAAKTFQAQWKKIPVLGHFLRSMENLNMIGENATRLATYRADIEVGSSRAEAAALAKDLMNFNRRGSATQELGAAWIFFNPAAQGVEQFVTAFTSSKHKHQVQALGVVAVGVAFALAEAVRGGDDDSEREYMNTPTYEKMRHMMIPMPGGEYTVKIPVAYGGGIFHAIGTTLSDIHHGLGLADASLRMADALIDHFVVMGNPIVENRSGGTDFAPWQMAPTLIKIPSAIGLNTDSLGRPISPIKYRDSLLDSQNMTRALQNSWYADAADLLNKHTGGDDYHPGWVDISPNTIKYWTTTVFGGLGTTAGNVFGIAYNTVQGTGIPEMSQIPVARKFVKERAPMSDSRSAYHKAMQPVKLDMARFKAAKKDDRFDMMDKIDDRYPAGVMAMAALIDSSAKAAAAARDEQLSIRTNDNISPKEKQVMLKSMELDEKRIYDSFLHQFDNNN